MTAPEVGHGPRRGQAPPPRVGHRDLAAVPAVDVGVPEHGRGQIVTGAFLDGGTAVGLLLRRAQPVQPEVGHMPAHVVGDLVAHDGRVVARRVQVRRPVVLDVTAAGAEVDFTGGVDRGVFGQLTVAGRGQPVVTSTPAPHPALVAADQDPQRGQGAAQLPLDPVEQPPRTPGDVGQREGPRARVQRRLRQRSPTAAGITCQAPLVGQQQAAPHIGDGQTGYAHRVRQDARGPRAAPARAGPAGARCRRRMRRRGSGPLR